MMTVSNVLQGLLKAASPLISPPPAIKGKKPRLRGLAPLRAMFSVLPAALALSVSIAPAHAGHYLKSAPIYMGESLPANSYCVKSQNNQPITNWADGAYRSGRDDFYGPQGISANTSAVGSIKYTFTWVPDNADDKPPKKVWIRESAGASWKGKLEGAQWQSMTGQPCPRDFTFTKSLDNGLGGAYVPDPPTGNTNDFGGQCDTRGKVSEIDGNDSFERSCSLSATASATGGHWRGYVSVGVGYDANVIATPYDFQGTKIPTAPYEHTLAFHYTWKSTTGNLGDLAPVLIYEHVEYPGGNATTEWHAPSPFTRIIIPHNPIDIHLFPQDTRSFNRAGSIGFGDDGHVDGIGQKAFNATNYAGAFTAQQEYRWYLPAIHDVQTANGLDKTGFSVLDGKGPMHPIARKVEKVPLNNLYQYTITKHGETVTWVFDPDTDL